MCAIRGGEDERWSATWTGAAAESVKGVGHRARPCRVPARATGQPSPAGLLGPRDARARRGCKRRLAGRPDSNVPSVSVGRGSGGEDRTGPAAGGAVAFGHNC